MSFTFNLGGKIRNIIRRSALWPLRSPTPEGLCHCYPHENNQGILKKCSAAKILKAHSRGYEIGLNKWILFFDKEPLWALVISVLPPPGAMR